MTKNLLMFERCSDKEHMYLFTSNISVHKARMNILDERIIVEHDVDCALPGVFEIYQRKAAIKFIESLFTIFSYHSYQVQEAYDNGKDARCKGLNITANPYNEDKNLYKMWYQGYTDAGCLFS